jgi:6-phosphofructokinase
LIVDCLERMNINALFVIGGDGTLRGAMQIAAVIAERNQKIAVVGIPKTIDNDIPYIDQSFGFQTAFAEATKSIQSAHVEAKAAPNGVGLVKLMGRHSGFIACYAALAESDANYVLIPEVPFQLEGPGGLLDHILTRVRENGHAVIVAAEGAGQDLIPAGPEGVDASGNRRLQDIGLYLKQRITDHFAAADEEPPVCLDHRRGPGRLERERRHRHTAAFACSSVSCRAAARGHEALKASSISGLVRGCTRSPAPMAPARPTARPLTCSPSCSQVTKHDDACLHPMASDCIIGPVITT